MPKPSIKAEFKSFSKGLITEASELNYPENAFRDGVNFELNKKGTMNRRLGFNFEPNYITRTTGFTTSNISQNSYSFVKWESAGGNPDKDFIVVQIRNKIDIYDTSVEFLSSQGLKTRIVMAEFSGNDAFSISPVKGALVVACGNKKLGLIKYNPSADTFSLEYFSIKVRDTWGVPCYVVPEYNDDDTYRGDYDPSHLYNLYNQSWGIPRVSFDGLTIDVTEKYKDVYGFYPSNSETVWPGLQYKADDPPTERVYGSLYKELFGSTVKAAKGYFIIDALDRGTSRTEAIANNGFKHDQLTLKSITLDQDSTNEGATIVAEFAGRVVYSGFNGETIGSNARSPDFSDHIFFSQLVNNERDYGKCYQEGDPTSRDGSDVVDTDGGFIRVTGAKKIVGLRAIGNSLIVIATNGVWVVVGGSDYGFSATNYRVDKLSVYGCVSPRSIVDDGDRVLYWGNEGIFMVMKKEVGDYGVSSISENTIQTFYNEISSIEKIAATGVYDMLAKKVRWIYQDGGLFGTTSSSRELVFDLNIGAFYTHKILLPYEGSNTDAAVVSAISMPAFKVTSIDDGVAVVDDSVVVLGDPVITQARLTTDSDQSLRYLVLLRDGNMVKFSFGFYKELTYKDWGLYDAAGYIITAHYTNNDSSVNKQLQCVTTHMRRTETGVLLGELLSPSGCFMSTCWNWSDNSTNGQWSREQQIYRIGRVYIPFDGDEYSPGSTVITTKNKMRGTGKAFSMKFRTEPAKDCQLIGWSIAVNGNAYV